MASEASGAPDWIRRVQDLVLPLAIVASVLVILVPLPNCANGHPVSR